MLPLQPCDCHAREKNQGGVTLCIHVHITFSYSWGPAGNADATAALAVAALALAALALAALPFARALAAAAVSSVGFEPVARLLTASTRTGFFCFFGGTDSDSTGFCCKSGFE